MPDKKSTPSAAGGLTLLGRSEAAFPKSPSSDILEAFPNRTPERPYRITFDCPEFTSLCPVTGQADFARVTITYIPQARCVESKSLKFYLASYRSTRAFGEDVANRILEDLIKALDPLEMTVRIEFSPRGGLRLQVEASYPG